MSASPFTLPAGATVTHKTRLGGDQFVYKMPNGYGASVVRYVFEFGGTYGAEEGKWELAVLDSRGELTYDTPITDDVIGWLDEDAVNETLAAIAALEPAVAP